MATSVERQAFAPVIALNNKGADFFVNHGDLNSARKCFRAAIEFLERKALVKFTSNVAAQGKGVVLLGGNTRLHQETRKPIASREESTRTIVNTSSSSVAIATRDHTMSQTTPEQQTTDTVNDPRATPPHQASSEEERAAAASRRFKATALYLSTRPIKLAFDSFGDSKQSNIRSPVARAIMSFNLALTYHVMSCACTSSELTNKLQRTALAFYDAAFSLRLRPVKENDAPCTFPQVSALLLFDMAILNNIAVLYKQTGNVMHSVAFFRRLHQRVDQIDTSCSLPETVAAFVKNLAIVRAYLSSAPAAAA